MMPLKDAPHILWRIESQRFLCFWAVQFSKPGGKFYFQSDICMKTSRTVIARATYVANNWLQIQHKRFASSPSGFKSNGQYLYLYSKVLEKLLHSCILQRIITLFLLSKNTTNVHEQVNYEGTRARDLWRNTRDLQYRSPIHFTLNRRRTLSIT